MMKQVVAQIPNVRAGGGASGNGLTGLAGAIFPLFDSLVASGMRTQIAIDIAKTLSSMQLLLIGNIKRTSSDRCAAQIKERLRAQGIIITNIEAITAK